VRRICLLSLLLPISQFLFAESPAPETISSPVNWITVWLGFLFGLLFTILFRTLNRYSKHTDQRSDAALPLGGWILFLGINLLVRFGVQTYLFWKANYFLKSAWIRLAQAGGKTFHSIFIFEMFLSLFALAGTGALIYWFYARRDIFPVMFIYYACFYLLANLVLLLIYQNVVFPQDLIGLRQDPYLQVFRILYASCWVVFVLRSEKVKHTFVYPNV